MAIQPLTRLVQPLLEDPRDLARATFDSELLANDLDYPKSCPQVVCPAISHWPLQQDGFQLLAVVIGQLLRWPRSRLGPAFAQAARAGSGYPLADSGFGRPERDGDGALFPAELLQVPRLQASPLLINGGRPGGQPVAIAYRHQNQLAGGRSHIRPPTYLPGEVGSAEFLERLPLTGPPFPCEASGIGYADHERRDARVCPLCGTGTPDPGVDGPRRTTRSPVGPCPQDLVQLGQAPLQRHRQTAQTGVEDPSATRRSPRSRRTPAASVRSGRSRCRAGLLVASLPQLRGGPWSPAPKRPRSCRRSNWSRGRSLSQSTAASRVGAHTAGPSTTRRSPDRSAVPG